MFLFFFVVLRGGPPVSTLTDTRLPYATRFRAEGGKARPKSKLAAYVGNPVAASNAAQGDLGKAALNVGLIDRLGDRTAFGIDVAKFAGVEDDDLDRKSTRLNCGH